MTAPLAATVPASIPSPSTGVLWLGPLPIRAYGILMVSAMVLAAWVTWKRYRAAGGFGDVALDATMWAIPFGIVGARLYHVITTPYGFFGEGGDFWAIFRIWEGGLAIFGAVGLGAVGAIIGLRRAGQRIGPFADALAPGLLFAQALGRFGNYFNQELFGSPTTLPWGLEIDAVHLPAGYAEGTLFHPTFLYEALWNVAMGFLIIYLGRRLPLKSGQSMALYMIAYPIGRMIMETMRLDEAREFWGLRVNTWTSLLVLVAGAAVFLIAWRAGAPTRISAAERQRFIDIVARKDPKRAEQLEALSARISLQCSESDGPAGENNKEGAPPEGHSGADAVPETRDEAGDGGERRHKVVDASGDSGNVTPDSPGPTE